MPSSTPTDTLILWRQFDLVTQQPLNAIQDEATVQFGCLHFCGSLEPNSSWLLMISMTPHPPDLNHAIVRYLKEQGIYQVAYTMADHSTTLFIYGRGLLFLNWIVRAFIDRHIVLNLVHSNQIHQINIKRSIVIKC